MNVIAVGGKSPQNTVAGVAVSSEGYLKINKVWNSSVQQILDETAPLSNSYACSTIELSENDIISLRVVNTTNSGLKLKLYNDFASTSYEEYLNNNEGQIQYAIPSGCSPIIITPNDWQYLEYIKTLRLVCAIDSSADAQEGNVSIFAVTKI